MDEIQGSGRAVAAVWVRKSAPFGVKGRQQIELPDPEGEANMALFLAAPGMLDALELVRERLEAWSEGERLAAYMTDSPEARERALNRIANYSALVAVLVAAQPAQAATP